MVMLPKGVLQELGRVIAPSKKCDYKDIRKRFLMNGYGPAKIDKWMKYFFDNEILTENEDGSYSCIWW